MSDYKAVHPMWQVDPQALAAIPPDEVPIAPACERMLRDVAEMPARAPDVWMQALQGVAVDLVNPTSDMIDFRTISLVLARIPRFGGHTRSGIYSVAQHCMEGAAAIVRDGHPLLAAAAFLIHDAHEAYIGDVTTPVQKALSAHANKEWSVSPGGNLFGTVVTDAFASLKAALDAAIYPAAGLPWPLPPHIVAVVKEYDLRMMVTERDARLDPPPYPWTRDAERVAGVDVLSMREGTVGALYWAACREALPACNAARAPVRIAADLCGND